MNLNEAIIKYLDCILPKEKEVKIGFGCSGSVTIAVHEDWDFDEEDFIVEFKYSPEPWEVLSLKYSEE